MNEQCSAIICSQNRLWKPRPDFSIKLDDPVTIRWKVVQLFILIVMRWQCYRKDFGEAFYSSLCQLAQNLCPYLAKKAVAVTVAYSGRILDLDSSLLSVSREDILWTKANLSVLGLVSREMQQMCPLVQLPVPEAAEAVTALCSCCRTEDWASWFPVLVW